MTGLEFCLDILGFEEHIEEHIQEANRLAMTNRTEGNET